MVRLRPAARRTQPGRGRGPCERSNRGSASVADVHLEQDSTTTAVIRTAEFRYRAHIDVQPERNLIAATTGAGGLTPRQGKD